MSKQYTLDAEMRDDLGKGASRRLRRENKIPAVLYGAGRPAWSLTLNEFQLARNLQDEAFYAAIIELTLEGKQQKVFLRDLQRHPAQDVTILHVDLQRVRDDVEMTVVLPLHYTNEDISHGVKMEGGQIMHNAVDIEITCLPGVLPQFIEVDMTDVKLGESVHLSSLKLPEGVVSTQLSFGEDHDQAIASIITPKAEKVEDAAPEAPVTESDKGGDAEGDDAKEGEAE